MEKDLSTDIVIGYMWDQGGLPFEFTWRPDEECPHLLICGGTGTGKSSLLHKMLSTWDSDSSPEVLKFLVFDTLGDEYLSYSKSPLVWHQFVSGASSFTWALIAIEIERQRRVCLIEKAGVAFFENLPQDERPPRLILVMDELHYISHYALGEQIDRILDLGRAVGIHVVATTQRGGPGHIRGIPRNRFPLVLELEKKGQGVVRGWGLERPIFVPKFQMPASMED